MTRTSESFLKALGVNPNPQTFMAWLRSDPCKTEGHKPNVAEAPFGRSQGRVAAMVDLD